MNYKKKGFYVGAAAGLVSIETYWLTEVMGYSEMARVILAAVIAGVISLCCEVVWEHSRIEKYNKDKKRTVKRAVDKAIEQFITETERDYIVIPRESYEAVHRHHSWKIEDDSEKQSEPIREVRGALAEDFANAPEKIKKEIFG